METGQQVFIFSNRVALSTQQKRLLLNKLSLPSIFSDGELRGKEVFGPVTVLTYQSALKFLSENLKRNSGNYFPLGGFPSKDRPGRGYVIFDEAHFFLNDATFNADTQKILAGLVYAFSYYTRIYLTATPENSLQFIAEYEWHNQQLDGQIPEKPGNVAEYDMACFHKVMQHKKTSQYRTLFHDIVLFIYKFPYDYSNYHIKFFTDIEFPYEEIRRASKDNKWLLFINSRKKQKDIADKIKEKLPICFDASKKEDEKIWISLMNGELPTNIFLTTSALDNGVNITDPGLKNIVIDFEDHISFLQMLGRKRYALDEDVNLFALVPSEEIIKKRLQDTMDLLSVISEYNSRKNFLQYKWHDFHQNYRNLFWVDNFQSLHYNELAIMQLNILQSFYSNLSYHIQNAIDVFDAYDVYPRLVHSWLGHADEIQWIGADRALRAALALRNFLDQNLDTVISETERESFFDEFRRLGDMVYNGKDKIKSDFRSGRSIIQQALDNLQEQLGAHYKITGKGSSGWKISKE